MSSCELYDQLWARVQQRNESHPIVLSKLAEAISGFDRYSTEMTFVLIRLYALRHGDNKGFQLPYEGKIESTQQDETTLSDVSFALDHFPTELQAMLQEFVSMASSAQEVISRAKSRSPRGSSGLKMFMKKMPRGANTFVLKGIDIADLDKAYSMTEILTGSDQNLFNDWKEEPSTRIDQIGIVSDPSDHHLLVIHRPHDAEPHVHMCCFYCSLQIPEEWLPIPVYDGYFCSFHCARSYASVERKSSTLLSEAYKTLVSLKVPIISPAPDRKLLEKFGGSLSEEEYRNLFDAYSPIVNMGQSVVKLVCVTADTLDGYSSYRGKPTTSSIMFKEAPRPSELLTHETILTTSLPSRMYKAN